MLYLRVAPRLPWTDSKGRARSAVEGFSFLGEEALDALSSGSAGELIVWEVGILVAEDAPPESKAQFVSTQEDADLALFAVGVGAAQNHYATLAPFWQATLSRLAGPRLERVILTDRFWHDRSEKWIDVGAALQCGLFLPPARLDPVEGSRKNLYTAEMSPEELGWLIQRWWPSGLGLLAGMSFATGSEQGVSAPPLLIDAAQLGSLDHYFETSRSFDNLGIVLISPRARLDDLLREVPALGWEPIPRETSPGSAVRSHLFRQRV